MVIFLLQDRQNCLESHEAACITIANLFMENPTWEVFCSDETRIQLEAITRRAWIKKGEKTVLKIQRSDDYQNYLGFLNQKSFQYHVFEIAWGNLVEVIKATGEFIKLYQNKKICIIWDNATCHKGILMRQALSKGGSLERVHLINLPPYAPDYNPIEHVCQVENNFVHYSTKIENKIVHSCFSLDLNLSSLSV